MVCFLFQDQNEISPHCSFDGSSGLLGLMSPGKGLTGFVGQVSDSDHPSMVVNAIYASTGEHFFIKHIRIRRIFYLFLLLILTILFGSYMLRRHNMKLILFVEILLCSSGIYVIELC